MAISSPSPSLQSSFLIIAESKTNALLESSSDSVSHSLRAPSFCCSVSGRRFPLGAIVNKKQLCRVDKLFSSFNLADRRGSCGSRILFTAFAELSPPSHANGLTGTSRRFCRLVPCARKKGNYARKRTWWEKFFFDDDGNWFWLEPDELLDEEVDVSENEKPLSENEKFEAWKKRAEAIIELREAQEGLTNQENRKWEDWLIDGTNGAATSTSSSDYASATNLPETDRLDPIDMTQENGLVENVRNIILGSEDDLLYEDRVFRYASRNSAIFLSFLIIVPLAVDFVVHDYVLLPFLDRYVKTVPFAAQIFDVRRPQKLLMVKELKLEEARIKLEVEIGKLPPLSEDETWLELRHKALELQEDWRLENRKAFANILSDMAFGITLFVLLILNESRVALLKFTGYKIVSNISDTGKAFIIILVTDIFLGYHSESGWQTLLEVLVEHYGLQVDHSAIIIFVCIIPVILDACVKLWLFKYLPRLSPKVSNIFQEMKRH
uniref:Chloroplast envelope membrane protein n=1 Tax=Kalanchoe fedtschenkoi TaxID=63787 RepID=A0A7N0RI62_KALFE